MTFADFLNIPRTRTRGEFSDQYAQARVEKRKGKFQQDA
jgi:hypothetical protein